MNAKNVLLKLAFVLLLVLLSIYQVFFGKGIRQGIDLRGGHSLIFEIRTNENEIKRLEDAKADLEAKLQKAKDETERKGIQDAITRSDANLENLRQTSGETSDLPERIINILKKRIDPQGLLNTEWRPLGRNRIEVRMPAAQADVQEAKKAYLEAMDRLEEKNIQRSEIRRLEVSPPDQRQALIHRQAGKNAILSDKLKALGEANDQLAAARQANDRLRILEALRRYKAAREAVEQANVNIQRVNAVLRQNVSPRENIPETERQMRQAMFESGLRRLLNEHSLVRQIEAAKGAQREKLIQAAAGSDADLRQKLEAVTKAADAVQANPQDTGAAKAYEAARAEVDKTGLDEAAQRIQAVADLYRTWINLRQGLDDPADLKRLIAKAGVLEFRIAPVPGAAAGPQVAPEAVERYKKSLYEEGPDALQRRNELFQWFAIRGDENSFGHLIVATDAGGQKYVLLSNQGEFVMLHKIGQGGWSLAKSYPTSDQNNQPSVGFEFDPRGAKLFDSLTGNNIGRPMAILLDNESYSAPTIQARISDRGIITGRFTVDQVNELVRTLEAGSLPARLNPEPVSESTFGPALGEINLQMAMRAGIWSLITVGGFMLVYYLLAGAIADVALLLNIIFILGAMSWLNAVFTLPGIAGVILSVGMAVDANVLIFERLREEQAKGQSVRMTLKNAYERAFSAIFDSNLTTLLTCAILGWVGSEEVRGFAITLGLGIAFNLFTAVIVTKWIFQILLDNHIIKRPLFMLQLIHVPRISWMAKRYFFYALSGAMLVLGIASIIWQGGRIWGIEFSAGTQAVIKFKDDALLDGKLPNDNLVEQLLREQAQKGGYERLLATARVEARIDPNQARDYLRAYDLNKDNAISLDEWKKQGMNPEFFTLADKKNKGVLAREDLEATLPNLMYQVTTSETHVDVIRGVVDKAFGAAQARRTARKGYEIVAGKTVPEIGLTLPENGLLKIEPNEESPLRVDLEDNRGGVLMVVQKIDPPLTEIELKQRIRDMRLQPDRSAQMNNPTEVRGLKPAGEKGFSSFAVLVRPSDPAAVEKPEAWESFAKAELEILNDALGREEAMIITNFDPAIAGDTAVRAGFAVVLGWIAIIAYLWLRFGSAQWGLAAVICLIHDVTIVTGLVAVSGWLHATFLGKLLGVDSFKIDLTMVAALLTIIGYSVNDTIVVFDRIRENRGKLLVVTPPVIDTSINQTLSRTLLTSATTLVTVVIMYIWGGPGIHSFNYALLVGIAFGTYSSIAIASPLLMGFKAALVQKIVGEEIPPVRGKQAG